jgi:heterodisulfide reductase subunit C
MAKALPNRYNPRRLLMRIYLDLNEAIQGDDLWLCAWCYRCTERCPQGLQPTEIFLLTRNFASEKGYLPENPRRLLEQIMRSGRSMASSEDVDEWRQEHGLPKIGSDIGDEALKEVHKIMGDLFERRVEKRS